jgi:lipopolysaccharide/colanic/teichoic acid biosynthesis glycosyltransferase
MPSFYEKTGKRVFDVAASAIGLIVLSPLLAIVAVAVELTSPGPAIFRQIRIGQFEMPFFILKFRSMRAAPQGKGSLLTAAGDPRVTALGSWLRKTKIDELPQLWNVLRGEMSLVGPRPEVPHYTSRYTQRQRRVFSARPGITSPQINFDEELLMASRADKEDFYISEILPAKLEIDLAYCQNIRFFSDMKILIATVGKLLVRPLRFLRSSSEVTRITPSPDA